MPTNAAMGALQQEALRCQLAAQAAWYNLMQEQIRRNAPWFVILGSAEMAGMNMDKLRLEFGVSPSTFTRWQSGFSSPSPKLRAEVLEPQLLKLAEASYKTFQLPNS